MRPPVPAVVERRTSETMVRVEVVTGSPEEFAAFIKSEMARMGPVIKSANFSN